MTHPDLVGIRKAQRYAGINLILGLVGGIPFAAHVSRRLLNQGKDRI